MEKLVTKSDEELMFAYQTTGDTAAFREIFERYAPLLEHAIARRVWQTADVEDVLQQTFLRLHRAREEYEPGEPLRPWLFAIMMNLCRDHGRRRLRRPEIPMDCDRLEAAGAHAPDDDAIIARSRVAYALGWLNEVTRAAFELHFFEDVSLSEIARRNGEKPVTVRARVHRGYAKLRSVLSAN
jgi:RNA polymerase sigma-70 factor (ECF subfamily)